jgi:hypothetical protein
MVETVTEDIAGRVLGALRDTSAPLWLPGLTGNLADSAWRKLGRDLQLTRASYSTARMLRRDPEGPRRVVAYLDVPSCDGASCEAIPIELLPEDLACGYESPDVRFIETEEILRGGVFSRVEEALKILGGVPSLLSTVSLLIRALHLIDPADDEIDVSFSEPALPFSAFVSVPGSNAVAGALRVAEALLHEAMHLQLTLLEAFVPLVKPGERTYFSPWRNEYRTPQGVLHALYVFRVIDAFLSTKPLEGQGRLAWLHYARERRGTIARQVQEVHDFRECVDLTADGVAFVERLLD